MGETQASQTPTADKGASHNKRAASEHGIAEPMPECAGKLRLIKISLLWIQEKIEYVKMIVNKVQGIPNSADMMRTPLNKEKLDKYMVKTTQGKREGRAKDGLKLKSAVKITKLKD